MNAQAKHTPARGFTLVELLVAVSLVMILLLGVNQVFRMTGQTVGAGQAISTAARGVRAMQSVAAQDGLRMACDPPFLIICNERIGAFLSQQDRDSDADDNPLTLDLNRNGTEGEMAVAGERVLPSQYNSRNHRIDRVGFFVQGAVFPRQTGQDTTLVIPSVSRDAWVWYGHARLPSKTGWFNPGESNSNNVNNRYAADFVLARFALLLKHPDLIGKAGLNEIYVVRRAASPPDMSPLTSDSTYWRNVGASSPPYSRLHQSRLDLAGTTIDELRGDVKEAFDRPPPANTDDGNTWWRGIVLDSSGASARFQCSPFIIKPAAGDAPNVAAAKISDAMALAAPHFVGNCSQFIVEFAGDWITQDNDPASPTWGDLTGPGPDGKIDFVVDKSIDPDRRETWVEKVRWYGLPRDSNDDGRIDINDVVPLFHVRRWYSERSRGVFDLSFGRTFPTTGEKDYRDTFERGIDPVASPPAKIIADYREDYAANANWPVLDDSRDDLKRFRYVCTWRAGGAAPPRMIRFIMRIEDKTGRLTTGSGWIETVLGPL